MHLCENTVCLQGTCSQETWGRGTQSEIICHFLLKSPGLKSRNRLGHIQADRRRQSESHFANLNCTVSQDSKAHYIQANRHCFSPALRCKSGLLIMVSRSLLWLLSFWIKQNETLADICRNPKVIRIYFNQTLNSRPMLFQQYQISQIFVQYQCKITHSSNINPDNFYCCFYQPPPNSNT